MKLLSFAMCCFLMQFTAFLCANVAQNPYEDLIPPLYQEEVYVTPDQIVMIDNDIFVLVDRVWMQTNCLYSDTKGLKTNVGYWICPICSRKNSDRASICENCCFILNRY